MWFRFSTNFKPNSVNSLGLIVIYCLVFSLNVCHSENVTMHEILQPNGTSISVNSVNTLRPISKPSSKSLLQQPSSATQPTPIQLSSYATTIKLKSTEKLSVTPSPPPPSSAFAASIINKLTTIRPHVMTSNSNGNHSRSSSAFASAAEKVYVAKAKQKSQMSSQQQQSQHPVNKISQWPSKPTGIQLIEGEILLFF